ncbi:MAG: CotH kinase family protein [Bacteroidetes bacterium]|nr:CotH kinase family protein [Bacteroidota bacterium]
MRSVFAFFIAFILFSNAKAQNEGNSIFYSDQIHEIQINFSQVSYWDSLVSYFATDKYMQADIVFDGNLISAAGVKFKGNSSYNNQSRKKSFKIDLNEFVAGQELNGLKKFNLNNGFKDPSFLREKIACDFYNEHGLNAPRCTFSKVYLNGIYWGLYNFIEEADTKQYLNAHFSYHDGNMFKGDPNGDLRYISNQASSYYPKYELHTNETVNDWSDLVELITKTNNSGGAFQDSIESIMNTETFIEQWCALNLFVNLDSYLGSGHNYFIYHDTNLDKFEWIGWDLNESFGSFRMNLTVNALKNLSLFFVPSPANSRPLINNMVVNNFYKQQLIDKACQWLQYDFSNAALDAKIDSIANRIRPHVYADTNKFYTNQNFDDNLSMDVTVNGGAVLFGLKSFIQERRNAVISEISSLGCITGITQNENKSEQFHVFPNPAKGFFSITGLESSIKYEVELYSSSGQKILHINDFTGNDVIDCSEYSAGIYFILINNKSLSKISIID